MFKQLKIKYIQSRMRFKIDELILLRNVIRDRIYRNESVGFDSSMILEEEAVTEGVH